MHEKPVKSLDSSKQKLQKSKWYKFSAVLIDIEETKVLTI